MSLDHLTHMVWSWKLQLGVKDIFGGIPTLSSLSGSGKSVNQLMHQSMHVVFTYLIQTVYKGSILVDWIVKYRNYFSGHLLIIASLPLQTLSVFLSVCLSVCLCLCFIRNTFNRHYFTIR